MLFAAKSESPNTTTRVSGFDVSPLSPGLDASPDVTATLTAAAIETGPFLSFPSSNDTCCVVSSVFTSDSAQLRGLVSTTGCAMWPATPPSTGATDRASGNAVSRLNRCVIGCDG